MSSVIPQQQRASRAEPTPSAATQQSTSEPPSSTSSDPQAIVLNIPIAKQTTVESSNRESTESTTQPEPRHCWICLQDEGIDSPENSTWRKPCPCNLEAHDECLLEWIADLETSNSGGMNSQIRCPQCKAEIKVVKPVDLVILTTNLLSRVGRLFIDIAAPSTAICCLFSGSLVYGLNAIQVMFGREETALLFKEIVHISPSWDSFDHVLLRTLVKTVSMANPFLPISLVNENIAAFFGLPAIAPALILSRASWADPAFIVLPIFYFGMIPKNESLHEWPPRPGLTFAVLPYLRAAYKEFYKFAFSDLEKQWDFAVQRKPREGETAEQIAEAQGARLNNDGVGGGILDVELEIVEVHEHEDAVNPEELAPEEASEIDQQPAAEPDANQQPDQTANNPQLPAVAANEQVWQFRGEIPTGTLVSRSIEALFLPAAASLVGNLLQFSLPRKWVTKPGSGLPTGLLQEKWGRSLVGGCLFMVLKDALLLYYKWKRAKNHEKRRIVDYVKKEDSKAKA